MRCDPDAGGNERNASSSKFAAFAWMGDPARVPGWVCESDATDPKLALDALFVEKKRVSLEYGCTVWANSLLVIYL